MIFYISAMYSAIQLFVGLVFLVKGADIFVEGASAIAKRFAVSDLVIGLTVVALGTSTPELFVNVVAGIKGNTGIAVGNIIGSCIANILLILGISSIVRPLTVSKGTVWKEIPFGLLAAVILGISANDLLIDGSFSSRLSRSDGITFLGFFVIFLYYSFSIAKRIDGMDDYVPAKEISLSKAILFIILGFTGLAWGGQWIVEGAVKIARWAGMTETMIGLTIVAVGTSLPELAASAVAAYRGNVEIAVGNVVGSNIFNIFFVLGISSIINPLPFQSSSNPDILVCLFANLLLFISMFTGNKRLIDRWEGVVFIAVYIVYLFFLIFQNYYR